MTVRYEPFALENIRDIVGLGQRMHEESAYSNLRFDIEVAAQSIYEKIVQSDLGFGVIAYKDDVPVGLFAGSLATHYFGPDIFAYDLAWYVVPEHRGAMTAVRMLKMFQSWAKDRGAREVHVGVMTNVSSARTGKLFKRLGYTHVGCNYTQLLQ